MSLNKTIKKGVLWGLVGKPFSARWELVAFWVKPKGKYRAVFSNLHVHQNYLEGLLKHASQGPTFRFRRSEWSLSTCSFNMITDTAAATPDGPLVLSKSFWELLVLSKISLSWLDYRLPLEILWKLLKPTPPAPTPTPRKTAQTKMWNFASSFRIPVNRIKDITLVLLGLRWPTPYPTPQFFS